MKKKYIYVIGLVSSMLFFFGCKKQLELAPLDQYSSETFWTNETNSLIALTGVYRGNMQMAVSAEFNPTDWWSYHGLLFLDLATDNAYDRRGDNSVYNKLTNGTMTSNLGVLDNYWTASYQKIARANYFIENLPKANFDESKKMRFDAEARFIRAAQYFYLSQYWGSVPVVKKVLTLEEANSVTKASKKEVVDFVVDELTELESSLPTLKQLTSAEKGRVSKQGALAFLGRILMAEKRFEEAIGVYQEIISLGENLIDPDYESLFNGTNEDSPEIVFSTQYLQDLASNSMMQHLFPAVNGGWLIYCPLGDLVETYEFLDGKDFSYDNPMYDDEDIANNRDPRLRMSILSNGQTFQGKVYLSHPDAGSSPDQLTTSKQATRTGYTIKKFLDEGKTGDLQNSGIDLPIIRYAEVLLSYLECKIENGDNITQDLLDQTINQIRGRSSVNMPNITETDPNLLREVLRKERRIEFAFEGLRLWDLQRWEIADEVLNGDFYGASFPDAVTLRKKDNVTDPHNRWYVTSKSYRSDLDRYWMIPQSEININPNLQ